jgi:hypothetical protein
MTYEEAGARFGLSAEAIRKRSRRLGWEVQPPNDPHARALILVPDDAEVTVSRPPGRPDAEPNGPTGDRPVTGSDMAELRTRMEVAEALSLERLEALSRERGRADAAQSLADRRAEEVAEARERAARAEAEKAAAEADLRAWTEGGPLARAVRALFWRRG